MSKETATKKPVEKSTLQIKILKQGTRIGNAEVALGAVIPVAEDTAKKLEKAKLAEIVGV